MSRTPTTTEPRPFRDADERLGAMRCGAGRCKAPSTQVAHIIGFPGRLAYCDLHAEEMRARYDWPTPPLAA